ELFELSHGYSSVSHRAVDSVEHPIEVGQVFVLDAGWRIWREETADPQDGRLEGVEALLGHSSGDLRAGAAEDRRLVGHDEPAGPSHGRADGLDVQRRQR